MLTICILILLGLYFKKPIGSLIDRLRGVDWQTKFSALWNNYIVFYGKKAGRMAARPILLFYYVVTCGKPHSTVKDAIC